MKNANTFYNSSRFLLSLLLLSIISITGMSFKIQDSVAGFEKQHVTEVKAHVTTWVPTNVKCERIDSSNVRLSWDPIEGFNRYTILIYNNGTSWMNNVTISNGETSVVRASSEARPYGYAIGTISVSVTSYHASPIIVC